MFPHIFSLFKYFIRQVETVEQMYMRGFYRPVSASTPSPSTSSAQRGGGLVYYQFKAILIFQEFSGQPGQGKEKHFLFPAPSEHSVLMLLTQITEFFLC